MLFWLLHHAAPFPGKTHHAGSPVVPRAPAGHAWRTGVPMSSKKLTKSPVESLPPLPKRYVVFDTGLAGFGISVGPTGHKSFILKHLTIDGTPRKLALGSIGAVTVEMARGELLRQTRKASLVSDPP